MDAELREWMITAFSTTEKKDMVVASVLMMGSMQKYFDFKCRIECGLPSYAAGGEKGLGIGIGAVGKIEFVGGRASVV